MKVIRINGEEDVPKYTGFYPFVAVSMDEAIAKMKAFKPGVEPHTVLWFPFTEKINRYKFLVGTEREE